MAFREVSVVQVREALRRWLRGDGERPIAAGVGVDRKTARRYIAAAVELGVDRAGGEEQLSDELIGQVVERVRPHRPDGHGEAWRTLLGEQARITAWVKQDLTVVKIGILLARRGVAVPHRTLARFAVERCGAGRRTTTVRVDDPPPGVELQMDFGRLGLVADGERRRVCWALIFTACFSRHQFVWPTFHQSTEEVIAGFEAALLYFGGVFPVAIPDNMRSIVIEAENTAPRLNDVFLEYAQSRGFVVDAARVATPTDKGCASHCTSWVGSDTRFAVSPALGRSADLLSRRDGRHPVVVGPLVVEGLAVEKAVVMPALDGLGADAQAGGGVVETEQAPGGEALVASCDGVVDAEWWTMPAWKGCPVPESTPAWLSASATPRSVWSSRRRSISAMTAAGVRRASGAVNPTATCRVWLWPPRNRTCTAMS